MPFFRAELTFIMLVMGLGVFLPLNTHADSGTNHPSSFINGFTIATLNTEWLWTPYDGKADGSRFNKGDMSPKAYSKELEFYRSLVSRHQIDILVVSEIENKQVAREMAEAFGSPWKHFFIQGRDTATGQDVGVLSRLPAISGRSDSIRISERLYRRL
jgi:hypothetical protein